MGVCLQVGRQPCLLQSAPVSVGLQHSWTTLSVSFTHHLTACYSRTPAHTPQDVRITALAGAASEAKAALAAEHARAEQFAQALAARDQVGAGGDCGPRAGGGLL